MNWGHKLTIGLVSFMIFIIAMVTISMRTDYSLVEENYYKEEIAYQHKIERLTNGNKWKQDITIVQESGFLKIYFEDAHLINEGEIHFFRASNGSLDFDLPIAENYNLPLDKLTVGKWELQFSWSHKGEKYQRNSIIYIAS